MKQTEISRMISKISMLLLYCILFAALLMMISFSVSVISSYEPETVLEAEKMSAAAQQQNLEQWFLNGPAWPGFRLVLLHLFTDPLTGLSLLFLFLSILLLMLLKRYYSRLLMREKDLIQEALLDSQTLNGRLSIVDLSEVINDTVKSNIQKEEVSKKKTIDLREQYENTLHQLRSKISSLYFISEEFIDMPSGRAEMNEILNDCDQLISNALKQSIYSSICFTDLLRKMIKSKTLQLRAKNITIHTSIDEKATLFASSHWIGEVINAVLQNAIDNTAPGLNIWVTMSCIGCNQIVLTVSNPITSDIDSGNSFERYMTNNDNDQHFGIGLHMIENVIVSHHGSITKNLDEGMFLLELTFPISNFESV